MKIIKPNKRQKLLTRTSNSAVVHSGQNKFSYELDQVLICAFLNNWENINGSTFFNGKRKYEIYQRKATKAGRHHQIAHGMDTRILWTRCYCIIRIWTTAECIKRLTQPWMPHYLGSLLSFKAMTCVFARRKWTAALVNVQNELQHC